MEKPDYYHKAQADAAMEDYIDEQKGIPLSDGLSCVPVHIERNVSSHSSYEFPYCVVDEKGVVRKRCETLVKAEIERDKLMNRKAR